MVIITLVIVVLMVKMLKVDVMLAVERVRKIKTC